MKKKGIIIVVFFFISFAFFLRIDIRQLLNATDSFKDTMAGSNIRYVTTPKDTPLVNQPTNTPKNAQPTNTPKNSQPTNTNVVVTPESGNNHTNVPSTPTFDTGNRTFTTGVAGSQNDTPLATVQSDTPTQGTNQIDTSPPISLNKETQVPEPTNTLPSGPNSNYENTLWYIGVVGGIILALVFIMMPTRRRGRRNNS